MLAKKNRLSRQDITPLMKRGRRAYATHVGLVFQKSPQPRFAVVISKKVAKTAVSRNRLRRRIYEFLRTVPDGLPAIEAMFIMQKGASTLSVGELREEILQLLKKVQ